MLLVPWETGNETTTKRAAARAVRTTEVLTARNCERDGR